MGASAEVSMKLPLLECHRGIHLQTSISLRGCKHHSRRQFQTTLPGNPLPVIPKLFLEIRLLGGYADYGVAWAKLHPSIHARLTSNNLGFKLKDNLNDQTYNIDGEEKP